MFKRYQIIKADKVQFVRAKRRFNIENQCKASDTLVRILAGPKNDGDKSFYITFGVIFTKVLFSQQAQDRLKEQAGIELKALN